MTTMKEHVDALIVKVTGQEGLINDLRDRVASLEANLTDDETGVYQRLAQLEAVIEREQVPETVVIDGFHFYDDAGRIEIFGDNEGDNNRLLNSPGYADMVVAARKKFTELKRERAKKESSE